MAMRDPCLPVVGVEDGAEVEAVAVPEAADDPLEPALALVDPLETGVADLRVLNLH